MGKYKKELSDIFIDSQKRKNISAPEDAEIKALCERLGYGAVMDSASRQWQKKCPMGAFTVGPCVGTLKALLGEG